MNPLLKKRLKYKKRQPHTLSAGLEGRLAWQIIDKRTNEVVREGEQKNLLLSGFMDKLATTGSAEASVSMTNYGPFSSIRRYFAVGTGTEDVKTDGDTTTISQAPSVVTASGAIFAATDVGARIVWDSGPEAVITSFTSDTVVEVDASREVTASEFTLVYPDPVTNPDVDSGAITAAQSRSQLTASAGFFEIDQEGDVVVFNDNSRAYIANFVNATTAEARDSKAVSTQNFTLWHISQTDLENEIDRDDDDGGFNTEHTQTISRNAVAEQVVGEFSTVRVIEFSSEYNLTEWGISDVSSGPLLIRELFRDINGDPDVITVQPEQQLKLTHTLIVTLQGWGVATYNPTYREDGENDGTKAMDSTLYSTSTNNDERLFTNIFDPSASGAALATTETSPSSTVDTQFTNPDEGTVELLDYVAGDYQRTKRLKFAPAEANGDITGISLSAGTSVTGKAVGYKNILAAAFTKLNTHRLNLDILVTWDWEVF
jgi:hypothetical protein